jgi:hypothetical protein
MLSELQSLAYATARRRISRVRGCFTVDKPTSLLPLLSTLILAGHPFVFAPSLARRCRLRRPPLHLQLSQLKRIYASPFRRRVLSLCLLPSLRLRTNADADLFETICWVGRRTDDAGTHELVHHIRGKATPEELSPGSFTRRKLKRLPLWDL